MLILKGLLIFSLLFSVASNATSIATMSARESAKLCGIAMATRSAGYGYLPLKLDQENVRVEKIRVLPIHENEFKRYNTMHSAMENAEEDVGSCQIKNWDKVGNTSIAIEEGWNKGILNNKDKGILNNSNSFIKNRNYKILKFGKGNMLGNSIRQYLNKLDKTAKNGFNSRNIPGLYLSDAEYAMIREHNIICARVNNKNKASCDSDSESIAKKLYPNFVFTKTLKTKFSKYIDSKEKELHEKLCAKELAAQKLASNNLDKQESLVSKIALSYGLNFNIYDGHQAIDDFLNGRSHIIQFTYRPTADKIAEINKDLESSDTEKVLDAEELLAAKKEPMMLFYESIKTEKQGVLRGSLSDEITVNGSPYNMCEESSLNRVQRMFAPETSAGN